MVFQYEIVESCIQADTLISMIYCLRHSMRGANVNFYMETYIQWYQVSSGGVGLKAVGEEENLRS